ncbi:MAG: helix-turn-helix domain-containing protein [Betaproteobacteria bacterium]
MLAEQLGNLVKDHRARKGLKQADLARSAHVSRSVVSRLEQGNASAVQTDILDRLFAVLEVSPSVADGASPNEARKQARLEQERKLERQRNRHLRLAIHLADDEEAAEILIAKARERVELWRRKASCSPYYVDRWSQLLDLPPRKMAKAMASLGDWEDALFQNSPWTWAWN